MTSAGKFILGGVLLLAVSSAGAGHDGHYWLKKMSHAVHSLNYDGEFIYQHDMQLESMRILHRVQRGKIRERIISLNGAQREILRDNDEVRCYLPDEKSVVVSHRQSRSKEKRFPAILPEDLSMLEESYTIATGATERVTQRRAQVLHIKPRDRFRYGYILWADTETGLLLKSALVGADGRVLEQFMFTRVQIGGDIADAALAPGVPKSKDMVWREMARPPRADLAGAHWLVKGAPKGFMVRVAVTREGDSKTPSMTHLVLSDGLAAVSVFIEPAGAGRSPEAMSHMGAVHAWQFRSGKYWLTVVGEVPEETVKMIAKGVVRKN